MLPGFYKDCEIFITGGSGVVGKALIEKLLRSCDVKRIYVLLREKNGITIEERLKILCNHKLFSVLRKVRPSELDKLVAIPGEASLPKLGITLPYAKMLENVSVFFHCAATVRFDDPLRVALIVNVGGTLEALKFAESLKKLKIFAHISTFFSNPYLTTVEPKVYSSPMDWKLCLKLCQAQTIDDNTLNALTKKLHMGFPNTYTLTKNLAENLVNDFRKRLPLIIIRPSVVIFAVKEPMPGYSASLMGASGLFAAFSAGVLKVAYVKESVFLDMIPLDICTKVTLYCTFKAESEYKKGKFKNTTAVPVCMISSRTHIPLTFKETCKIPIKWNIWDHAPLLKNFLIPGCYITSSRILYMFLVFTMEILPAILFDRLLILFGRKPVLMALVRKLFTSFDVMKPFLYNTYESNGITDYIGMVTCTKGTEFDISNEIEMASTTSGSLKMIIDMNERLGDTVFNQSPEQLRMAKIILKIKKIIYNMVRFYLAYKITGYFYKHWISATY